MATKTKTDQERIVKVQEMMKNAGYKVYTVCTSVSRSGMYRHIKTVISLNGEIIDISGTVSDFTGRKWHDEGAVGVGGCGMDMGFEVVYAFSARLYGDGYKIRQEWI